MPQQQLLAFRPNTRQKRLKIGTFDYTMGGSKSLLLPEVGYLARVWLFFVGSITYSAAGVMADLAPYSLFRRIQVTLNNSATDIFNVSGFGTFLINSILTKKGRLDQDADAGYYAAPLSGSAQPFVLGLQIPISMSQGMNFEAGLINLQAPEVQCQLNVDFHGALTDIGTNITALTGTCHAYYEYYEVPSPAQVMQPAVVLHRWLEQTQPVNNTGEVIYTVPRGGNMLRLLQILRLNNARADSYDEVLLRFNQSETVYKQEQRWMKILQRERYGYNLPVGVISNDWAYALQHPEESDLRDAINTEMVTTTDGIVTVSSGASLGTNNNFLTSIREILQSAQPI
jgi:hypothetical protein